MAVRNFERLMDLRTIHRNLASGLITKEEVAEYRRGLPDASEKFEVVTIPDDDEEEAKEAKEAQAQAQPSEAQPQAPAQAQAQAQPQDPQAAPQTPPGTPTA